MFVPLVNTKSSFETVICLAGSVQSMYVNIDMYVYFSWFIRLHNRSARPCTSYPSPRNRPILVLPLVSAHSSFYPLLPSPCVPSPCVFLVRDTNYGLRKSRLDCAQVFMSPYSYSCTCAIVETCGDLGAPKRVGSRYPFPDRAHLYLRQPSFTPECIVVNIIVQI